MASLVENANRIQTDKEAIRQALIAKGVEVAKTVSLDDYAGLVEGISAGNFEILKTASGNLDFGTSYADIYTATKNGKIIVTVCATHYSSVAETSVEVKLNGNVLKPNLTNNTSSDANLKPVYNQYIIEAIEGDVINATIQHKGSSTVHDVTYLYSIIG